jgi:hypothetical protein
MRRCEGLSLRATSSSRRSLAGLDAAAASHTLAKHAASPPPSCHASAHLLSTPPCAPPLSNAPLPIQTPPQTDPPTRRDGMAQLVQDSVQLARMEGLEGHARSAECRLTK